MSGYQKAADGENLDIQETLLPIECLRCGVCCTRHQPQLNAAESGIIARGLKMSTEDFLTELAQFTNIGYLLRRSEKGCVFLTVDADGSQASCTIHHFRPEACRNWVASLSRGECREGADRTEKQGRQAD